MLEFADKSELRQFIFEKNMEGHGRKIKDLGNLIDLLERTGLIEDKDSPDFICNLFEKIPQKVINANYSLEDVISRFQESPHLSQEDVTRFKKNTIKRLWYEAVNYDGKKEAIKTSIDNELPEEFTKTYVRSVISNDILIDDQFKERFEDFTKFLQENKLNIDIIKDEMKKYFSRTINGCNYVSEEKYLLNTSYKAKIVGLPEDFVKIAAIDRIKKRIESCEDKTGRRTLPFIKKLAEIFEIAFEDYKTDLTDNIENFNFEYLKKFQLSKEIEQYNCNKLATLENDEKIRYLVEEEEFMSDDLVRNTANQIIADVDLVGDYNQAIKLKNVLKERKIGHKNIFSENQKNKIYESLLGQSKYRDTMKFVDSFMTTDKMTVPAIESFKENISGYLCDMSGLDFIDDYNLNFEMFRKEAIAGYEKQIKSLQNAYNEPDCNVNFISHRLRDTIHFALGIELPKEYISEPAKKAMNGFLKTGDIKEAYRIAEIAELPEQYSISRIKEVMS
ncbi:MAG: hypothetical protein U9R34_07655 [Nanoarchaeota archaeon]|nr:hypothetical protein [Nanoarchaeota archaeon]